MRNFAENEELFAAAGKKLQTCEFMHSHFSSTVIVPTY